MGKDSAKERAGSRRFHLMCTLLFTTVFVVNAGGFAVSEVMKRMGPVPLG